MEQLSKCCNAEIITLWKTYDISEMQYYNCSNCGNPLYSTGELTPTANAAKKPDPTPPTSTEVEEIDDILNKLLIWHWEKSKLYEKLSDVPHSHKQQAIATQAITRLIQQAELRGRIDQMKAVRSQLSNAHHLSKDVDTLGYLHDTYQSMELALQSQLAKGGSDDRE